MSSGVKCTVACPENFLTVQLFAGSNTPVNFYIQALTFVNERISRCICSTDGRKFLCYKWST